MCVCVCVCVCVCMCVCVCVFVCAGVVVEEPPVTPLFQTQVDEHDLRERSGRKASSAAASEGEPDSLPQWQG